MPRTTKTPAKRNTYERRDPSKLKNHPLNITIYGDAPQGDEQKAEWEQFLASVKERGIDTPLLILPDNTIVSGHRRNRAARILGLKEVPVIVRNDLEDDLDAQETLIVSNRETRTRTNQQKALEYQALRRIEQERANARRSAGGAKGAPGSAKTPENIGSKKSGEPVPHSFQNESGRASTRAAEQQGEWSRKTAERASTVQTAIKEAQSKGQHEKADELTQTLNQSVSRAYDKVKPKKKAGKRKAPKRVSRKEFNKYYGKLRRLFTEAATAVGQKEGPHHRAAKQALETVLDEFRKMMKGRP